MSCLPNCLAQILRSFCCLLVAAVSLIGIISPGRAADTGDVRITGIHLYDQGSWSDSSISSAVDLLRDYCGTDATAGNQEKFYTTLVGVQVINSSHFPVNFQTIGFRVRNADGKGKLYQRRRLATVGGGWVDPGTATHQVLGMLLEARGGRKYFTRSQITPAGDLGFRNVRVILKGTNSRGAAVTLQAVTGIFFQNIDRCR